MPQSRGLCCVWPWIVCRAPQPHLWRLSKVEYDFLTSLNFCCQICFLILRCLLFLPHRNLQTKSDSVYTWESGHLSRYLRVLGGQYREVTLELSQCLQNFICIKVLKNTIATSVSTNLLQERKERKYFPTWPPITVLHWMNLELCLQLCEDSDFKMLRVTNKSTHSHVHLVNIAEWPAQCQCARHCAQKGDKTVSTLPKPLCLCGANRETNKLVENAT